MPLYYGFGYGMDMGYLLVALVALVIGGAAQAYIRSTYRKWSQVPASVGGTGADVARRMLEEGGAAGHFPVYALEGEEHDAEVGGVGRGEVFVADVAGHAPDGLLQRAGGGLHAGGVGAARAAEHRAGGVGQVGKAFLRINGIAVRIGSLRSDTK